MVKGWDGAMVKGWDGVMRGSRFYSIPFSQNPNQSYLFLCDRSPSELFIYLESRKKKNPNLQFSSISPHFLRKEKSNF